MSEWGFLHRHQPAKVLDVWHGENLFGNVATVATYLCRKCGKPYSVQVWGRFTKEDLEP